MIKEGDRVVTANQPKWIGTVKEIRNTWPSREVRIEFDAQPGYGWWYDESAVEVTNDVSGHCYRA